jgi:hypothetical protein
MRSRTGAGTTSPPSHFGRPGRTSPGHRSARNPQSSREIPPGMLPTPPGGIRQDGSAAIAKCVPCGSLLRTLRGCGPGHTGRLMRQAPRHQVTDVDANRALERPARRAHLSLDPIKPAVPELLVLRVFGYRVSPPPGDTKLRRGLDIPRAGSPPTGPMPTASSHRADLFVADVDDSPGHQRGNEHRVVLGPGADVAGQRSLRPEQAADTGTKVPGGRVLTWRGGPSGGLHAACASSRRHDPGRAHCALTGLRAQGPL